MMPRIKLLSRVSLVILVVISLFLPDRVNAAFVCYNEKYFPSVFRLLKTENGIEAYLGGVYADSERKVAPVLSWQQEKGWRFVKERKCLDCETNHHGVEKCLISIPKWSIEFPKQPYKPGEDCRPEIIIEESASSCDVVDNVVWFGINFYRGEGYTGYGGIARYDQRNNLLEVRRIPALRDYPIHKVVWDGKNVWAATTTNYECIGHPPALGLVKYDWQTKVLSIYKGTNVGPCGFIIHDLLWDQGFLWVATDVGISRWDSKNDEWTHYLPDQKAPYTVKGESCEIFYRDLLSKLPRDKTWFDEPRSYYQIFYENLRDFRPNFIKLYKSR
jgi:hypothetical protein